MTQSSSRWRKAQAPPIYQRGLLLYWLAHGTELRELSYLFRVSRCDEKTKKSVQPGRVCFRAHHPIHHVRRVGFLMIFALSVIPRSLPLFSKIACSLKSLPSQWKRMIGRGGV